MLHIYACCKHMFQVFHTMFASVTCGCCICLNGFQMFFRRFRKCFRRLFQVFLCLLLYVTNIAFGCFKSRSGITHGMHVGSGGGTDNVQGDVQGSVGPLLVRSLASPTCYALICSLCATVRTLAPSVQTGASKCEKYTLCVSN
jgi:hypothetical protein